MSSTLRPDDLAPFARWLIDQDEHRDHARYLMPAAAALGRNLIRPIADETLALVEMHWSMRGNRVCWCGNTWPCPTVRLRCTTLSRLPEAQAWLAEREQK